MTTLKSSTQQPPVNIKKIWVAIGTPFQANFFAPIIEELREKEFFVTARDHDNIKEILDVKQIPYTIVGKHGGKELDGKLQAYARNIEEFLPLVRRERPDLLLTERWPEAVRVAFGFDIPAWTIFYDERERHVNQMVFPLSSKVFAPRCYTFQDLYRHGVIDPEKVIWFNGFHTCYLKDQPVPRQDPKGKLGVDPPVVLIRPEPDFASFFPSHEPILEKTVKILSKNGGGRECNMVVFPRTEVQAARYATLGVSSIANSLSECPLAHADVALGAAETMLMEAFTLGRPAISAIYWSPSKPVAELHKYIPHSTDPNTIAKAVQRYLDPDQARLFSESARLVVKNMDNPVKIMINEIRKLSNPPKVTRLQRRSKMEILVDIVEAAALRPCRPTQIMRQANISHTEFKDIIENLEKRGLVKSEITYSGRFFQTTVNGLQLLTEFRDLKDRLFGASS